ncbi:MAG: hypothetical protein MZV70_05610 [Desulfobacterales bacterium]|nr:hypothetical protein [Desulfobacterales bacterium]
MRQAAKVAQQALVLRTGDLLLHGSHVTTSLLGDGAGPQSADVARGDRRPEDGAMARRDCRKRLRTEAKRRRRVLYFEGLETPMRECGPVEHVPRRAAGRRRLRRSRGLLSEVSASWWLMLAAADCLPSSWRSGAVVQHTWRLARPYSAESQRRQFPGAEIRMVDRGADLRPEPDRVHGHDPRQGIQARAPRRKD